MHPNQWVFIPRQMESLCAHVLHQNHAELIHRLEVNPLVDILSSKGALSPEIQEEILAAEKRGSRTDAARILLDAVQSQKMSLVLMQGLRLSNSPLYTELREKVRLKLEEEFNALLPPGRFTLLN